MPGVNMVCAAISLSAADAVSMKFIELRTVNREHEARVRAELARAQHKRRHESTADGLAAILQRVREQQNRV